MKQYKLPLGTAVKCTKPEKYNVCEYLIYCGCSNPSKYNGSGSNNLGLDIKGIIRYSNEFTVANTITYAEFQKLIAEPTEPVVINEYDIF